MFLPAEHGTINDCVHCGSKICVLRKFYEISQRKLLKRMPTVRSVPIRGQQSVMSYEYFESQGPVSI